MKKNTDNLERFFEMRAAGLSYEKIGAALSVSKPTLIQWARENRQELANRKALALDETLEKYRATRTARIALFGGRLKALEEEAARRDLKDIPTAKLLELEATFAKHLREELQTEEAPVQFEGVREVYPVFENPLFEGGTEKWAA